MNGDGYSDVIIGADGYSSNTGKVYVCEGSSTGLDTTVSWTQAGENTGDRFGVSVSTAGDVDGDGYSDVIIGASGYSSATGKAYVYEGSSTGLDTIPSWTQTGNVTNDAFGISVASAGDVNGDGYSDIIIGADNPINNVNSRYGKAYVFDGSSTGLSSTASWTQTGEGTTNYSGACVGSAGDINGDGYSDIIVGAGSYPNNGYQGKVYVYYGSSTGLSTTPSWTKTGENTGDAFGNSVASAGDVNGDGYSDVIIGAYGYASSTGKVYVYYGSPAGLDTTASWTKTGEGVNDEFGFSVASAGDVNGDGYSDVIIGASGYSSGTGKAYVYDGSSAGLSSTASWTKAGENTGDRFGVSVSTAGDVDGDGYSDVIIGASGYSSATGKAYVYNGSSTGLDTTASWTQTGEGTTNYFGASVGSAGDVNGDGYSDIIVGALFNNSGAAYVYYGSSTGLSSTASWVEPGISVASAGDVNGDGYSDVVVGLYTYSSGGNLGYAKVYYRNSFGAVKNYVQQYQPSSTTILGPNGSTTTDGSVRLSGYAKSPFGRAKGKLVYEYKSVGTPFSGQYSTSSSGSQSSFTDLGTAGTQLNADVTSIPLNEAFNWRVRTKYSPVTSPFLEYGPWRYYTSYQPLTFGSFKSTVSDHSLSVQATGFTASAEAGAVRLSWNTQSEVDNAGFDVLRESPGTASFELVASYTTDAGLRGLGTSSTGRSYHFTDAKVQSGQTYEYEIQSVSTNGRRKILPHFRFR